MRDQRNNVMRDVKINRDELLTIVRANKEKHIADYDASVIDCRAAVLKITKQNLKLAQSDDVAEIAKIRAEGGYMEYWEASLNPGAPALQRDHPLERQLRPLQNAPAPQAVRRRFEIIGDYSRPTVRHDSGPLFFRRRRPENIETEIVTHDARQQIALGIVAVNRVLFRGPFAVFNRRPRRQPQRIHTRGFIENFRNVPPFGEHGHTDFSVFDLKGAAAMENGL